MKELYGVAPLIGGVIATTLLLGSSQDVAAAQPIGIKNVVLVHGAFADGSGWEPVAKILEQDGYTVSVAQPPETSYAEDVKYAKAAVDAMDGVAGITACFLRSYSCLYATWLAFARNLHFLAQEALQFVSNSLQGIHHACPVLDQDVVSAFTANTATYRDLA